MTMYLHTEKLHSSTADYTAVIATFRRPESLELVISGLAAQTKPPSLIVIVDNDPDRSADPVGRRLARDGSLPLLVVRPGTNLGPAGGWALGVDAAQSDDRRGDYVAVFDDDDGVEHPNVMAALVEAFAAADDDVAAIGLRGARCDRRTARLHRSRSNETGSVDYLASGGAPLYRWAAVDRHGFFDPLLFFGFEDLELGLRLRAEGLRLLTIETEHVVGDSSPNRTTWREYFKTRALVVVCRRHLGLSALGFTLARSLVGGALLLLVRDRRPALVAARWRGALDGLSGRLGERGRSPTDNPAKG